VSLPVSNFGGFIVGFLLALFGGAMAVAWAPGVPPAEQPAEQDTTGEGGAPEATDYDTTLLRPVMGEPNDLSGTSPVNGANGRHSAG